MDPFEPRLFHYRFRTPAGTEFTLSVWGCIADIANTDRRAGLLAAYCKPVKS